ncbi:MAG: hypothetical protein A2W31_06850 [Planctomycetes bacterium RBG_16_64_10]|nr:MAG: hypothetical protein A2W31_06850 [Planctomycetes bacterium RBG_16_64_10]
MPAMPWRYAELETAHLWRMTPWEFDARPNGEKAQMMAYAEVHSKVENWGYEAAERAAKDRSR